MEYRELGRTKHQSSVIALGTYAIGTVEQAAADETIEYALSRGINHFDVAPTYDDAELRLGDYLKRHPLPDVFIGCKTVERNATKAKETLHRTLDRLGLAKFDLYQLHAVCTTQDLDACFAPDGAMEAILDARAEGLIDHIGITGHGWHAPSTHRIALDQFDFATVMTSCNLYMVQNPSFREDWELLVTTCALNDVGIHMLKASARIAWGERTPSHGTWYEPFSAPEDVDRAIAWALHQPVTTLCSAGDLRLLPAIVDAAERYREIDEAAQLSLLHVPAYGDIFANA